jgi:hypothetical protein
MSGKKLKKKSNGDEMAARIEAVMLIRLEGAQLPDVRTFAGEKGWAVSDSMLRKYISKADLRIARVAGPDHESHLRYHLAKRRMLYGRCVTTGEYATALSVLKDEADLLGLYPEKSAPPAPSATVNVCVVGGVDLDAVLGRKPALHASDSLALTESSS